MALDESASHKQRVRLGLGRKQQWLVSMNGGTMVRLDVLCVYMLLARCFWDHVQCWHFHKRTILGMLLFIDPFLAVQPCQQV